MRLCIIDPAHRINGLTLVFPEAHYFAHKRDSFYDYEYYSVDEFKSQYGYEYKTDWSMISSDNYDYVFIVFTLYDAYTEDRAFFKQSCKNMLERIYDIIRKNQFKKVILFDVYDYDPTIFPNQHPI